MFAPLHIKLKKGSVELTGAIIFYFNFILILFFWRCEKTSIIQFVNKKNIPQMYIWEKIPQKRKRLKVSVLLENYQSLSQCLVIRKKH